MNFDILTIFPEIFRSPLEHSILKKAIEKKIIQVSIHDIRDHAKDKHKSVDDTPYGGGAGMVMRPDVVISAIESVKKEKESCTILLTPSGELLNQKIVKGLSKFEQLILVCGRYEGIDQRVADLAVDREISIGDYVLNGGESAALVLIDAVSRLIPGVLGNEESIGSESFENCLLEHPHYTRPNTFRGLEVPKILLSGNHAEIEKWRLERSIEKTRDRRPDLLLNYERSLLLTKR